MTSKELLKKARDHYPEGSLSVELVMWDHGTNVPASNIRLWIAAKQQFFEGPSLECIAAAIEADAMTNNAETTDQIAAEIDAASAEQTHPAVEEVIQELHNPEPISL